MNNDYFFEKMKEANKSNNTLRELRGYLRSALLRPQPTFERWMIEEIAGMVDDWLGEKWEQRVWMKQP